MFTYTLYQRRLTSATLFSSIFRALVDPVLTFYFTIVTQRGNLDSLVFDTHLPQPLFK